MNSATRGLSNSLSPHSDGDRQECLSSESRDRH
jgi:hypothetical protein